MKRHMINQRGGTILGLIIGLVVGLGIAVIVALMITKTATPFTNKLGMNKVTDLVGTQLSDPNKPLYGNSVKTDAASKPAEETKPDVLLPPPDAVHAPDVVKLESKSSDTRPDFRSDYKAETKADARAETKAEAKPDSKSLVRPADSAVVKGDSADDGKWRYFLQVGAFRDATDAESSRAKLALLGFEAHTSERTTDNGTLYRVRMGPFDQMETMNRMRSKLSENSVDVAVVRTPK